MASTPDTEVSPETFIFRKPSSRPLQKKIQPLQSGEAVEMAGGCKISNSNDYQYYEFQFKGSIIRNIAVTGTLATLWALAICMLYYWAGWRFLAVGISLITILSLVVGLLLVFRTNTAYDRYWEARKLWGTLITHIRNLSRYLFVSVNTSSEKDLHEKTGALNLLLAFAVSLKHHLRDERGVFYDDLYSLLIHVPNFSPEHSAEIDMIQNLPLEISHHVSQHIAKLRAQDKIDIAQFGQMMIALSGMIDCMSNLERIRTSPLPISYSIHLRQTLLFYIFTLPFQLLVLLGWVTVPVVFIASFTLLGYFDYSYSSIESIGTEIEQPFGYDYNDLRLGTFCNDIKEEMKQMVKRSVKIDSDSWLSAVKLEEMENYHDVFQTQTSIHINNIS